VKGLFKREPSRKVREIMRIAICVSILVGAWLPHASLAQSPTDEYVRDLQSSVPTVRERAAVSLGNIGDKRAVPSLIEALGDSESGVRRETAKALGFIKDARAVPSLVEALSDGDTNVRLYAAYALGEIKDAAAVPVLLKALSDPEWCVRDQAAWALREIRDPKIAKSLVATLKEENADMAHVLWILRNLKDAQVGDHLTALLKDADAQTRKRAVTALRALGGPNVIASLITALDDDDSGVRYCAVRALARIGDKRVKKPLEKLAAREQDAAVRKAAENALVEMSPRKHLVAWWSFNDRNAEVAKDVTGRGNNGTILGCTPAEGKVGAGLQFSKGKYIEFGQPAGLPIGGKPFTVMAWAKSDTKNGVVIARGGAFCGYSLYIKDGVAKFGIHRIEEGPGYIAAGTEDVVGSWVHLAGVVNIDCIELYVNGKLAATAKTPGYIPGNCGQGMEIGYDVSNSPAEIIDNFEGIIDEVKIYQAALDKEDVFHQSQRE